MSTTQPQRRQRVAAYAVCIRTKPGAQAEREILLARLSGRVSEAPTSSSGVTTDTADTPSPTFGWAGAWTLPGGGLDHGEDPRDAVVREVYEETGLPLLVGPLLEVDSRHFVGDGPRGPEDYHAIRLLYAGSITSTEVPQVIEEDGSTSESAWVDLRDLAEEKLRLVPLVATALQALADYQARLTRSETGLG